MNYMSAWFFLLITASLLHAEYTTDSSIPYYSDPEDPYQQERCVLDLYYPKDTEAFPTVVWFHAGGIKGGEKYIPEALMEAGIAIAAVNYRLSPKVTAPAYIEDAAAAIAWVFKNINEYGGDPSKIFISGHSAGGYLVSMVGLDKKWLEPHGIDADSIAGIIPFSGHTITHFTVREERGIPGTQVIVDELAPMYHARNDAPPYLLITADRDMELLGRYEENAYMWRMMQEVGHPNTEIYELDGYDHGNMVDGGYPILLRFIEKHAKN
jgi:acetyl esterase/lipase